MLVLGLLLTTSLAQAPVLQVEVRDATKFRLGTAVATARLDFAEQELRIEVIVTNPTATPLFWYGAGSGCSASQFLRPPIDEAGAEHPELMGMIIACSGYREPTEEDLEEWRLDPEESRTIALEPLFFWFPRAHGKESPPLPTLTKFAWATEFTLPVGSVEEITYGIPSPMVIFAWERGRDLRVFVDGADGDVEFPHFDPFDATPFFREGPTPFTAGPLIGEAELLPTDPPTVRIALRNPTDQVITWGRANSGSGWTGWTELFLDEQDEVVGEWMPRKVTVPSPRHKILPGATHSFALAPFTQDILGDAPAPKERWHWVCDGTWPEAGDAAEDAGLSAYWHLVWDPTHGLAVALTRRKQGYEPFGYEDAFTRHSAVLRVGAAWILADALRGEPRNLEIRILPVDGQCWTLWDFADLAETEEFRWETEPPFGALLPWHEPDPPLFYPRPSDRMDWIVNDKHSVSGYPHETRRSPSRLSDHDPAVLEAPWEWRRVILVPRAEAPTTSSGLEAVLLTVRWSQESGLCLTSSPAPAQAR